MRPDSPARSGTSLLLPQENKTGGEGKNELRGCKPTPPVEPGSWFWGKNTPKALPAAGRELCQGEQRGCGVGNRSRCCRGKQDVAGLLPAGFVPHCKEFPPPGVASLQCFHSSQLLTGLAAQCSSLHTGGFGLGAARCCGDDGQILTLALSCSPAVPPLSSSCTRASFLPLCSPRGCLLPGSQPLTPPRAGSAGCWGFSCLTWKLFCFFFLSLSPSLLSALSFPFSLPASLLLQL